MTTDVHSPLLKNSVASLPSVNLHSLLSTIPLPTGSNTRSQINSGLFSDPFGVLYIHNAQRLLDQLGYGHYTARRFYTEESNITVNPALICAYHAINFDFYRMTDRDLPNINLSNMDNYANELPIAKDFLSIYYRPWKRDFYTNLEVSPLFGGYTDSNFNTNIPQSLLSTLGVELSNVSSYVSPGVDIPETSAVFQNTTAHKGSIDTIRRSAALERLAQLQRFNDKFWNNQISALFGVEVPDNYEHVVYLGSHHSNIQFSDVVASATTEGSTLGEIAGKGLALPKEQRPIEFETKQHGFILGIYSATPLADYIATGIDRINTYHSRNDFYNPAYDNLGMQPKYYYEANFDTNQERNNTALGWTYRWQELKQKPDLVHGGFVDQLRYWVTSRNSQVFGVDKDHFIISPKFLDSIMLVIFGLADSGDEESLPKQAYIDNAFGRDPLLHELYFKSIKYSNMSTFSLPSHNEVML